MFMENQVELEERRILHDETKCTEFRQEQDTESMI